MATSRRRVRRRGKTSRGKTRMRCQECKAVGVLSQRPAAPGGQYRAAYRHAGPYGLYVGTGVCTNGEACAERQARKAAWRKAAR